MDCLCIVTTKVRDTAQMSDPLEGLLRKQREDKHCGRKRHAVEQKESISVMLDSECLHVSAFLSSCTILLVFITF